MYIFPAQFPSASFSEFIKLRAVEETAFRITMLTLESLVFKDLIKDAYPSLSSNFFIFVVFD